jgi:hypothetical protein
MNRTYAIQYRTCKTIHSPAGKWKDVERGIHAKEKAEKLLEQNKAMFGFNYDFALCVEYDYVVG